MFDTNGDTAFTQHTLDALQARAKAAIHNIANQNVEGFKRYEVKFEEMLREAVKAGESEGFAGERFAASRRRQQGGCQEVQSRLDLGHIDLLSLAGAPAMFQRRQHR